MKSTAGVKVYLAGCGGVKNGCVASPVSGILARRFINDALGARSLESAMLGTGALTRPAELCSANFWRAWLARPGEGTRAYVAC